MRCCSRCRRTIRENSWSGVAGNWKRHLNSHAREDRAARALAIRREREPLPLFDARAAL